MVQILIRSPDKLQVHSHRTWEQFKHLQKGYEGSPGVRLSFFEGIVEVLVPGRNHEIFKTIIGALIELFLFDRRIEFTPTGSMTQEVEGIASTEADESYEIGGYKLSIAVIITHGSIAKLALYQVLGVHEVWFWQEGVLTLYHLRGETYERIERSHIPELAAIDIVILANCILTGETSRIKAMADFQAAHPVAQ